MFSPVANFVLNFPHSAVHGVQDFFFAKSWCTPTKRRFCLAEKAALGIGGTIEN
jgi:hypothetical protein